MIRRGLVGILSRTADQVGLWIRRGCWIDGACCEFSVQAGLLRVGFCELGVFIMRVVGGHIVGFFVTYESGSF